MVLAGLPILSFLQFLGGVDPDLMLAGFMATAMTMLSLGALGILCSVLCKKARNAIVLTYLLFLAYHALSAAGWLLLIPLRGPWRLPSVAEMLAPLPVAEFVAAINSGNIASTLGQLARAVRLGGRLDLVLPELLRDYVVFHGLAALACGTWAVLRLRALALKEAPIKPAKNLL